MPRPTEKWLEIAKVPLPDRLSLRSVSAWNMGNISESHIREGYTEEEMRAGVKMLNSVELLERWRPVNPRSVALSMCLDIGWDDDVGVDNFDVYVVTNDLRPQLHRKTQSWIFVDVFEWPKVLASLLNILRKCERATWEESVQELRKRFDWEYEGMAGT